MLFDEEQVHLALARVCQPDGATLGTAFFVLPGIALTCHHLVESRNKVLLDCGNGQICEGIVADVDRFPDIDLAIVTCDASPHVKPLAIVGEYQGISRFWTKGFHYYGRQITEALPASGEVGGVTSISFSTDARTYQLNNVLVLKHDIIDSGLSGAPVIDPDTGVVFAIINAQFGRQSPLAGFALPLSRVQEHSACLRELFVDNSKSVARYGRFLNYLGAREICRRQREAILERLIQREIYMPDLYIQRAEQPRFDDFNKSDALILPIIGNAGVGKTMLLADLTSQIQERPVLLLLGRDLSVFEPDLFAAITSRLRETVPDLLGVGGTASLVVEALQKTGQQLTVLLDGLNEIPASAGSMPAWIERTVTWLQKTKTKLVLTSRLESWQTSEALFPEELVFREKNPRQKENFKRGMLLGDFSETEAIEVKERYGLSESLSTREVRHPLMARIYWELQAEGHGHLNLTRYRVMQRFIKRKCDRIALAVGQGVLSSHVEFYLREAARLALNRGGFELEDKEFFDLFAGNSILADQSVHEGLFMTISAGKRFTFDEIAEFLQSKSVDLAAILNQFLPETANEIDLTPGAIVYAVLRLEDEGQEENVIKAIETLIAAHGDIGKDAILSENAIAQLLPQIHKPERFMAGIEAVIRTSTERFGWLFDDFGLRAAVTHSKLPLGFKLDMLKIFLALENSEEFSRHHWDSLERSVIRDKEHTGYFISELIRAAPGPTFKVMVSWLDDATPLRRKESTIENVAGGLMFCLRHSDFNSLFEALARSMAKRDSSERYLTIKEDVIFREVAENDPQETLEVCLEWITRDDPLFREEAARLAMVLGSQATAEAFQHRLYQVLSHAIGRVGPETELIAKIGIGRLPIYRKLVIGELISFFKQGTLGVGPYEVARFADTHFDLITPTIKDLITAKSDLASGTLLAFCRSKRTTREQETLVELLKFGGTQGLLANGNFRSAVDNLIEQTETESDAERNYKLVEHLASCDQIILSSLKYFAAQHYGPNDHRNKLSDKILQLVVKYGRFDIDDQSMLVYKLASNYSNKRDSQKYILALGEKMPADKFHLALVSGALRNDEFGKALAEWLESDPRLWPHGSTKIFIDNIRKGCEVREAARAAFKF
jgi:hypothetical protein